MNIPKGLNVCEGTNYDDKEDCVVLVKAIYGLVQAARQYFKKFKRIVTREMNFKYCEGDECLMRRDTEKGTVILCVYVDDILYVGDHMAVNEFKRR